MRIISQDGTIDVPYETSSIAVSGKYCGIYVYSSAFLSGMRIGVYDTHEQALAVMREIREDYKNGYTVFKLPKNNEVKVDD